MRKSEGRLIFSPSDLVVFMESSFASWMDRFNLEFPGQIAPDEPDQQEKLTQKKGFCHEKEVLGELAGQGLDIQAIPEEGDRWACTLQAMHDGRGVVYQAALRQEPFAGYVDFLVRVSGPSRLGAFHYEVWDAKLAMKPKPYFIVQLCCYSEMLESVQGIRPAEVQVVLGSKARKRFRVEDYFYFYRHLKESFLAFHQEFDQETKPLPSGFENCGRWAGHAGELLERCDHPSRVAGITAVQTRRLQDAGIGSMKALAESNPDRVPKKMDASIFQRLRSQAQLQIASAGLSKPKFQVVEQNPMDPRRGLALLPPPSPLDVFFDMEGYPFVETGLEYLFGAVVLDEGKEKFHDWWAHDSRQERAAFEGFVDWAYARWRQDPSMHIYHYANYEVAAIRKLMGKFGTREDEVDELLRKGVFCDLYLVVRQGMRVGEPSYSIKNIEHLYMDSRAGEVASAGESLVYYERWLELQDGADWRDSATLRGIRDYNRDDCVSLWKLAEWLRKVQRESGIGWMPKPSKAGEKSAMAEGQPARLLADRILSRQPGSQTAPEGPSRVDDLLAWLLEFHRRENKPVWWAMFDRRDKNEEQLVEDLDCLGGLKRTEKPPEPIKRSMLYEYRFDPDQDTKREAGDVCYFAHDLGLKTTIEALDAETGRVALKIGPSQGSPPDRLSLIPDEFVNPKPIPESILETVSEWNVSGKLPPALSDFLLRRRPRIKGNAGGPVIARGADLLTGTMDAVRNMDNSAICIQGPPGTGKTYTAAHVILGLVKEGAKVGVTSNSHKAICNLLAQAARLAKERGQPLRAAKIGGESEDSLSQDRSITFAKNIKNLDLSPQGPHAIGGTAWTFSDPLAKGSLDYLFVDEAGQVSIANLTGMAPSARNIVLIGDQMQLAQPVRGSHPGESGCSCLDYLLQGRPTIPEDMGVFLAVTRRMHPDICRFISESIYEGRLQPDPQTRNRVARLANGKAQLVNKEAGMVFLPVEHEGNTQGSDEEVEAIKMIVNDLKGRELTDAEGKVRKVLGLEDILFVAPFNMQVRRLQEELGASAKVGSIDKFQGQEAPVVIVSMCASAADAAPRGLDFLLNANRLNVAISRAQSLAIVVASPRIVQARCSTPEQMRLMNLFCRIMAQ